VRGRPALKIAILGVLCILALAILMLARAYTLDLVSFVVCRAYLQKSPHGVAEERARAAFAQAVSHARGNRLSRNRHLQELFEISQRLEKLQRLSEKEALEILESLEKQVSGN
jgi:hypothetical protein